MSKTMSNPTRGAEWAVFYENSLDKFTKDLGFVPTFEEFQKIVLESDHDLGYE